MEPMLSVTLTPTMASASTKINVIPSRAQVRIDCRVPPGLGEDAARQRIAEVLGSESDDLEIEFTEQVTGNQSPIESRLMTAIERWVADQRPGRLRRAADPARASRTRSGFATRSPSAWPTASSPSATRRYWRRRR